MDVNNMSLSEIELRLSALASEVEAMTEVSDIESATEEKRALLARKAELAEIEQRKKDATDLEAGAPAKVIEKIIPEERKMFDVTSKEYRDAFYAYLSNPCEETRTSLINVDGDTAGTVTADAVAIPKTLDTMIWDNIHTAHPILADVSTVASGIMLEVTKHTAIATRTTSKKDADAAVAAENNTFVKVTLAGKDYDKYVELTYAEAKMSQGALEQYLAQEIAAELGEALAKDVFAQIVSDAGTGRKVTKGDWFANIAEALGKANHANNPVIYASVADYYAILGATDTVGQPIFRDGLVLQANLKKDNAVPAGTVVVVDPAKFVLNEVQGIMLESDKDVKAHRVVVSGYLRAEGCMRDNAAAAYIA